MFLHQDLSFEVAFGIQLPHPTVYCLWINKLLEVHFSLKAHSKSP